VEVLKQPQYQPMRVDQQVIVIFAVTNGLIDDVDVPKIKEWEKGLLEFIAAQHSAIVDEIKTKKAISDDLSGRLKKAIEEYKALGSR
jgi:F-type H+-transporting ATPase subunit alpha